MPRLGEPSRTLPNPTGVENYQPVINPMNPAYGATADGSDVYTAVAAAALDAATKNMPLYFNQLLQWSKSVLIPLTDVKTPRISSVNTSTYVVTFDLPHLKLAGDPIMLQGATPSGTTKGVEYYFYPLTSTTGLFYNTRANALAGGSTGKVAITTSVTTTGSISSSSRNLTVAAEINGIELGTNVLISGASGASGGFYIIGGLGTGTLTLNTTSNNTVSNVTVTYVSWIDHRYYTGGFRIIAEPGCGGKKHINWNQIQGQPLISIAQADGISIRGFTFEGLADTFVPSGVTGSCSGTNQITITVGDTTWITQGAAFTLGGGATTYFVDSFNSGTGVITAFQTTNSPSWPTVTNYPVGAGLTCGIIGLNATGTNGAFTATMNKVDNLFIGYALWFSGDTNGAHTITAINPTTKVITFSNALNANLTNAGATAIGGDDLLRLTSVHNAEVDNCIFRHCGDAAIRLETNVADYQAVSTSNPNGGVNTGEIYITKNTFFNIHQTSCTTNDFMHGGATNVHYENNTFDYLRGSVKFACRTPGGTNIFLTRNTIMRSDDKGFELASISNVKITENILQNIVNYGIYMISNNEGSSSFGLGVVDFAYDGLLIDGNTFDNCGSNSTGSSIRIQTDTYTDGTKFDYPGVRITNNTFKNVTNTSNIGVFFNGCSLIDLLFDNNAFQAFQGQYEVWGRFRGSVTSGFVNGMKFTNNDFTMSNSGTTGLALEQITGTEMVQNVQISGNKFAGTCTRAMLGGNLKKVKIHNNQANLISGAFWLTGTGEPLTDVTVSDNEMVTTGTTGWNFASITNLRLVDNQSTTASGTTTNVAASCSNVTYINNKETGGTANFNSVPVIISVPPALVTKTANYTMTLFDSAVNGDATSGSITITIPDATTVAAGHPKIIKKTDSSANTVTIVDAAGKTIDGAASVVISIQYASYTVMSNGTNWSIV